MWGGSSQADRPFPGLSDIAEDDAPRAPPAAPARSWFGGGAAKAKRRPSASMPPTPSQAPNLHHRVAARARDI